MHARAVDLAERAVRELGDAHPVGRDAEPRLERGVRPVPGRAARRRFRAAGRGGLHGAGDRGRASAAGQAGDGVAGRADEVARQGQDRVEQVLRVGAAQDPAASGTGGMARRGRGRRQRLHGRAAALARVPQGSVRVPVTAGVGRCPNDFSSGLDFVRTNCRSIRFQD